MKSSEKGDMNDGSYYNIAMWKIPKGIEQMTVTCQCKDFPHTAMLQYHHLILFHCFYHCSPTSFLN